MIVNSETVGGVTVLSPSGRIDSNTAAVFETSVTKALAHAPRMILDFSDVPYISSAGLRVVLVAAKKLGAKKGGFALCGLSESVLDVFQLSGFASILTIMPDRDAALQSMAG